MTKTVFMDKYPIYMLSLQKSEITYTNVAQIIAYFQAKIEAHPIAKFIAVFDHYMHTKSLNGDIMEGLKTLKTLFFALVQRSQLLKLLQFALEV